MTSKRVIIWQTILIIKITQTECSKSQIVTLNAGRGQNIKKLPYAFTEQGVAMLSSVLLFCHIHWASEDTPFSFYLPHPQTFSKNSLHLSEEKRIFAAEMLHSAIRKQDFFALACTICAARKLNH